MSAARLCPVHHVRLTDELLCRIGRGRHVCERWLVVEVRRGKAWAVALSSANGIEQQFDCPLSEVPKMSLSAGPATKPPVRQEPTKPERPRAKHSTNHASARFVAGKRVLVLSLIERHDLKGDAASAFRVRWVMTDGAKQTSGVACVSDSHGEGMAAWQREVAKAQQAKWERAERTSRLELRPVPAPRG